MMRSAYRSIFGETGAEAGNRGGSARAAAHEKLAKAVQPSTSALAKASRLHRPTLALTALRKLTIRFSPSSSKRLLHTVDGMSEQVILRRLLGVLVERFRVLTLEHRISYSPYVRNEAAC